MSSECFIFNVHQISSCLFYLPRVCIRFFLWVTILRWMIYDQLCYKSTHVNDIWPTLLQIDPCEWYLTNFVTNRSMWMISDQLCYQLTHENDIWPSLAIIIVSESLYENQIKKKIHIFILKYIYWLWKYSIFWNTFLFGNPSYMCTCTLKHAHVCLHKNNFLR